jgi:Flp pilus assembly protein TadG
MNKSVPARRRVKRSSKTGEKGFVLVACMVCAVVLFGMTGLAIDLGRMYITKNEAQSFADSAALYAAQQLDGTSAGITAADHAVATNPNGWNFGTTAFTGSITEYSADGSTNWQTSDKITAATAVNIRYARVTPVVNNVALFFLPVTGTGTTATVKAQAIAGQVLLGCTSCGTAGTTGGTTMSGVTSAAMGGAGASSGAPILFPYSPIANVDATNSSQLPATGDPFGFTRDVQYDLKWPGSPTVGKTGNNKVPCGGDNNTQMVNRSTGSNSHLGEIVLNSASSISNDILTLDDAVGVSISINQSVNPTTGDKNKEVQALNGRTAQDTDNTSVTYTDYLNNTSNHGNGRRLITVIVNGGYSDSTGKLYPANQQAVGLGYAQFLLLPTGSYNQQYGDNSPWCAVYVGPAPTTDTPDGGVGSRGRGVGVVRLTN